MDPGTAAFARRGAWTDAGFALALGVLVVIAAMTVWSFEQHAAAARAVAHTEQVRTTLGDARWALADLRARELTSFLQPGAYRQPDVAVLRSRLAAVRDLTVDNAEQQARLADVDRALTALVGLLRARAYAPGALSSQDERVATAAETDRQLRGLNEQMAQLDTAERRLLEARTKASEARLQWLGWAIATLVGVLVVLLALLYANVRRWQKQEDGLLRAEQRFQLMAQNVAEYAILMLDPSGNVLSWNTGAERLEGWSAEEILGSHVSRFYPPEDVADGKPGRALECAATAGRFEEEGWRMRKDGSRFWAFVVITALRDQGGAIAGFLKITRDLTDRRRAEEALRAEVAETHRVERQLHEANLSLESQVAGRTAQLTAANADLEEARGRLQELSAHLIASQEEERRRISRELHDETGQSLTGIKLRLSAGLRDGSLGVKGIEECIAHVDATIRQIRQLSLDLRPLVLDDLGLADALEGTLQQMGERAGWDTRLDIAQLPDGLPPALETTCFRITQEALTNAARHARAHSVEVNLLHTADALVVTIRDDGVGFDLAAMRTPAMRRAHFGLVSMGERASLAGGSLTIDSSPGDGTTVRVRFPLAPREAGSAG